MEQGPQNEILKESALEYDFDQGREVKLFYSNIKKGRKLKIILNQNFQK